MKQAINTAASSGKVLVVAYVDENNAPQLSYRGSAQAFSDTQLAVWVRNPQGRILTATRVNPAVALIYGNFDPSAKGFMTFHGRAHVDESADTRRHVYEQSPEGERNLDKDRKGVAVIVDLDSVDGFFGGALLKMRR
jgi:hypothetical protein